MLVSGESALLALQVTAAAVIARVMSGTDPAERSRRQALVVGAHVLALIWLTLKVRGHFQRIEIRNLEAGVSGLYQARAFAITAVWALYAAGLFAAGILMRSVVSRLVAVALFGAVVLKHIVADLTPPQFVAPISASQGGPALHALHVNVDTARKLGRGCSEPLLRCGSLKLLPPRGRPTLNYASWAASSNVVAQTRRPADSSILAHRRHQRAGVTRSTPNLTTSFRGNARRHLHHDTDAIGSSGKEVLRNG